MLIDSAFSELGEQDTHCIHTTSERMFMEKHYNYQLFSVDFPCCERHMQSHHLLSPPTWLWASRLPPLSNFDLVSNPLQRNVEYIRVDTEEHNKT